MREIAGGRQNGDLEIALDLAKSTKFLDRRDRSLLSPHQHRRLAETTQRVPHVDVEITGKESGRRVTGTTLMRGRVIDLDQLTRNKRIVRIGASQISPQLLSRDECVEHCRAGDWCVDREASCFTAQSDGLVQA